MVRLAKFSTPILFKSKLLCLSLIYLFSALFLAVQFTFSATKCLFRSSPFDPLLSPLFNYPSSYGEHKYAIPTTRSSCHSPVYFSDYFEAFNEIEGLCANSSNVPLKYMQGNALSFGGNFSDKQRFSYFDSRYDAIEIPCGFFKHFLIGNADVPDSALILRKHSVATNLFSCLMFNELEAFNPRDQLPFAYVRDKMKSPKLKLNMFEVEVFEQEAIEYRHNLKKAGPTLGPHKGKKVSMDLYMNQNGSCGKCEDYLLNMWGE